MRTQPQGDRGETYHMQQVPGGLTTATRPPTTIPLRHVLVALVFLLAGAVLGVARIRYGPAAGSAFGGIAVAHLLLVGWVTLTIIGAMTQFVPVWSGVGLRSKRLATAQLLLVSVGVAGFAGALWVGRPVAGIAFAACLVAGFGVFVYNLSRTLWRARPLDVTEGHFALALGFFAITAILGGLLAADYRYGVLATPGLARSSVIDAHVTVAVFGGVLATVIGALYQLGPMFTQSDATALDDRLVRTETVAYPVGVALLATGRLVEHAVVAAGGGLLVATGVLLAGVVLARRLANATTSGTPMLSRYAVVALAAVAWSLTAAGTWASRPLGVTVRFGHPDVGAILLGAVVGFVVVGSLYHVVPFIVWLERYSDRVGLERVPAIDDLYDRRLATTDLGVTVAGSALLVVSAVAPLGHVVGVVRLLAGVLLLVGASLFAANLVYTVGRHGGTAVIGSSARGRGGDASDP